MTALPPIQGETALRCGTMPSAGSEDRDLHHGGGRAMSQIAMTSTGHGQSDAPWLDAHFQTARPEYEEALGFVGIQAGWTVLDAGCGSGGYVPIICAQTGPAGRVSALDLAPEH